MTDHPIFDKSSRPPAQKTAKEAHTGQKLEITHLQKRYGKRVIIKDVSLTLHPGEVVALLGPNGCGKTTCFYCIAGIVKHEGGTVRIDG